MTPPIVHDLWLIPAAPLLASLLILGVAGSKSKAEAAILTILGQVIALRLGEPRHRPIDQPPGLNRTTLTR